ncbi:MAG: AraC family transcriptional regulator [bacterium]|nr:AraC family transcriptional regulator [bacterium]
MSADQIVLVVISGLGVIHGVFLALFLFTYSKGSIQANRLLALLLIVLSFRIGKSVFLEFTPDLDVKFIFTGLGTMMFIGPLFLLLVRTVIDSEYKIKSSSIIHFIPALLGIGFGLWINDQHLETLPILVFFVLFLGYYFHYLIYLLIGYRTLTKIKGVESKQASLRLVRLMFYGLLIIWLAYITNLFEETIPYIIGPVLYSIVAYAISFIVIKNGLIEKVSLQKYKSTQVSDDQIELLFNKVIKLFDDEEFHRSPDATLKNLAQKLNTSTQVLSMVINEKSNMNFNNFVNQYRINHAIQLFKNQNYDHQNIASIAFEVGFNSISSFNTAFKKQIGTTPLSYRKELSE